MSLHQSQAVVEGMCEESLEKGGASVSESIHSVSPAAATLSHPHSRYTEPSNTEISTSEWHINFSIPELRTFSQHVKDAVASGIILGKARREVIQVLRT